jgi:hypothetical protein
MKNPNYALIDNEGGGDCLFATIRDAFSSIAQQTTVQKLRKRLSEEMTQDTFDRYKEHYDMYRATIEQESAQIKELAAQYKGLVERYTSLVDRADKVAALEESKQVKARHDRLVKEKKVSGELLKEFLWMKGIDSMEAFQRKVQSCDFWADEHTLQVMEEVLHIKFIVLSSENWRKKDLQNVLHCGSASKKDVFVPEYYLMVDHTGDHYKLISYKKKQIFTFHEIPFDIKHMIFTRCMERNAGGFAVIPEFVRFKRQQQGEQQQQQGEQQQGKDQDQEPLNESKLRGLYDDEIVFQFYADSNDKPLPGKGSGEKIRVDKVKAFSELATIPQWRKKLDTTWASPFTLDNHQWATVTHYIQASKYKTLHPDFFLSFSLDSGTVLSKDVDMAIGAAGKTGKYKGELLRPKEVKEDPDADKKSKVFKIVYAAQYAKFTQNEELKALLLATKDAKLVHYVRGMPAQVMDELMQIRDKFASGEK